MISITNSNGTIVLGIEEIREISSKNGVTTVTLKKSNQSYQTTQTLASIKAQTNRNLFITVTDTTGIGFLLYVDRILKIAPQGTGARIEFNDNGNAKTVVESPTAIMVQFAAGGGVAALTNGNGTTANGTAVDLGGAMTGNVNITVGAHTFTVGGLSVDSIGAVIGGANRNPLSVLDLQSTTKGLLIPRMTEAERLAFTPVSSEDALLVYQTNYDTAPDGFYYYSNFFGDWKHLITSEDVLAVNNTNALLKTLTSGYYTTPASLQGFVSLNYETDCSGNPNYPAAKKGDTVRVTVAGLIGGASGKIVAANDLVVCAATNAGGTEAAVGTNWIAVKGNLNTASFNTNWRGVSATNPLAPIVGDWYNNSVTGEIFSYDGANWVGWDTQFDDFLSNNAGMFNSTGVTSGLGSSATWASTTPFTQDLNSVQPKQRHGVVTPTVTNANNARAMHVITGVLSFQIVATSLYMVTWVARLNNTVIDFANDPLLAAIGIFSDTNSNPTRGLYVRAPRLGETAFLKVCIRAGGIETTITDTTVPYVAAPTGFFQFSILIDTPNDTVRVFINTGDGGNVYTTAYTNFLVNNPTFVNSLNSAWSGLVRNGAATIPIGTSVVCDSFSRSTPRAYKRNR